MVPHYSDSSLYGRLESHRQNHYCDIHVHTLKNFYQNKSNLKKSTTFFKRENLHKTKNLESVKRQDCYIFTEPEYGANICFPLLRNRYLEKAKILEYTV